MKIGLMRIQRIQKIVKDKYNNMNDKVESQQKLIEALLRAQNIEPDKFIV